MIPKEIALQLVQLKEKSRTYSAIHRSYKIDEIRTDVAKINNEIGGLTRNMDNILVDGISSNFEIKNWVEDFKDKLDFAEPNPRLIYEEEKREIERKSSIEEEKRKLEHEEDQKRLQAQQIDEFRKICLNRQSEDINKLQKLVEEGFDVNSIGDLDRLTSIIFSIKSLSFIKILVDSGLHITEKSVAELYAKYKYRYNEIELLDILINAKNIDPGAIDIVKETIANQKIAELELQQRNEEVQKNKEEQKKLNYIKQSQIAEFRFLCYNGPDDINKIQQLINDGLDISERTAFYSIATCIARKRSIEFIHFLVDSGFFVTKSDVESCLKNSSNSRGLELMKILISAKNIDENALVIVEEIKSAKENNSASIATAELSKSFNDEKVNIENTNAIKPPRIKESDLIFWIIFVLLAITVATIFYIYFDKIMGFFKIILIILLLPFLLPIILKKR